MKLVQRFAGWLSTGEGNWVVVLKCLGCLDQRLTVHCSYCQLSFACCTGQPNLQTSVIHTGVSGSLYSIPSVNVNTGYAIHGGVQWLP